MKHFGKKWAIDWLKDTDTRLDSGILFQDLSDLRGGVFPKGH
jgi:hypothetical protein